MDQQKLLNQVEDLLQRPHTLWSSHAEPTGYVWELALLAYVKRVLARPTLLSISSMLQLTVEKFLEDYETAFSARQLHEEIKL